MAFDLRDEYGRQAKRKGQKLGVQNGNNDPFGRLFNAVASGTRSLVNPRSKQNQSRSDGQLFKQAAGLTAPEKRPQNFIEKDPRLSRGPSNVTRDINLFAKGGSRTRPEQSSGGAGFSDYGQGLGQDTPLWDSSMNDRIDAWLDNEYLKPRSAEEITAFARKGADEELANLMKALDEVLGTAQSNYKVSDRNLNNMYSAHQKDVRTNSRDRQQDISDEALAAVRGTAKDSTADLSRANADKDRSTAGLLANLGIEAAAAQPDDYDPLAEAQAEIAMNSARSQDRINESNVANLAATDRMADSIGLEGKNQRAALGRLLSEFQNNVGMQRAGYQSDHAAAMRNLAMQGEAIANQERANYGQFQFGLGQQMIGAELEEALGRQAAAEKANQAQLEFEREMQLLDREQDWRYRTEQAKSLADIERAKLGAQRPRPADSFDPVREAYLQMLRNGGDPNEAIRWYSEKLG